MTPGVWGEEGLSQLPWCCVSSGSLELGACLLSPTLVLSGSDFTLTLPSGIPREDWPPRPAGSGGTSGMLLPGENALQTRVRASSPSNLALPPVCLGRDPKSHLFSISHEFFFFFLSFSVNSCLER